MIESIKIITTIIALLYFLGYGITTILLPERLKSDSFFVIPWVGIIFTITLSVVLSMARVPTQSIYIIVILAAIFLLVYSILLKKRIPLPNKDSFVISILVLLIIFLHSYSFATNVGQNSVFNGKSNIYTDSVEYLKNHTTWTIFETTEVSPSLLISQDFIQNKHLWGGSLLLSFFSSIFQQNSSQILTSLMVILYALLVPLIWILIKQISGKSHYLLLIIIIGLLEINPVFRYLLYQAQLSQILFIGIFGFITTLLIYSLSHRDEQGIFFNGSDVLIALAFSSLSSTYPDGFVLTLGLMVIVVGIWLLVSKRISNFAHITKICFLAIILNPFTFGVALLNRNNLQPLFTNNILTHLNVGRLSFLCDSLIMLVTFALLVLIPVAIERLILIGLSAMNDQKEKRKNLFFPQSLYFLLVSVGYLIINFIFNQYLFWSELIFDRSKIGAVYGEVQAYEWSLEHFYQAFISGHNPFGVTMAMLYPFGIPLGLVDAGNGIFFVILRPFLSTHQAFSALIIIYLFLANIGMYLILRILRFDRRISFIIGAAFGYMTFLMPRGGHLNYWCHYLFPWFYLCVITLFTSKKKSAKTITTIGAAIFFILILYSNFYYFIILLISIGAFLLYFFIVRRELFIKKLKLYWMFILFYVALVFTLLIPWLSALYEQFTFDQVPKTVGWGGAIEFSSDLFNYFLPSGYNYVLTKFPILIKPIALFLRLYRPDARAIFENFTYPGIIIIASYFILLWIYKRLSNRIKQSIAPFFFVSFVIFILTLGPFLHIFGRWAFPVDGGIKIVIPLPYIILHYLPFLNNIRAPGRLAVGFIFFSYIIAAYVLSYLLRNASVKTKNIVFIFLLIIFFIDHRYYVNPTGPPITVYPNAIYNEIKKDPDNVTVLEIPFTVRDGFTYFADINGFQMMIGESVHGKSVLGGYSGRIPDYKKNYYVNNPFLGYIGRVIDLGIQSNQSFDKSDMLQWQTIDIEKSQETLDFFDTKYVVMNDQEPYTASLSAVLNNVGFIYKNSDHNFSLWERQVLQREFLSVDMKESTGSSSLGFGWFNQETNFRWSEKRAEIMFKIENQRMMTLHFTAASFGKGRWVTVYLDKKPVDRIYISSSMNEYSVPLSVSLSPGLRFIYFSFDSSNQPKDLLPNNLDTREISAKFNKIWLSDH